jgi:hypothetical protein
MKMTEFRDMAPRSRVELGRRCRGAYCLHHQNHEFLTMEAVRTSESSICFYENTVPYLKRL